MLLYGDLWDLEAGLMRKSAAQIRSACNGLFPFPEGKKCEKKRHCLRVLGVFPLKGKYVEEPVGFVHCIIVCIVNIKDKYYSRLSAPMSFFTIYCMGLVRVNKE